MHQNRAKLSKYKLTKFNSIKTNLYIEINHLEVGLGKLPRLEHPKNVTQMSDRVVLTKLQAPSDSIGHS